MQIYANQVNITFQYAEPPGDQICQVSFQYHKLHRFYGKLAHQLLRSSEMTHIGIRAYQPLPFYGHNNFPPHCQPIVPQKSTGRLLLYIVVSHQWLANPVISKSCEQLSAKNNALIWTRKLMSLELWGAPSPCPVSTLAAHLNFVSTYFTFTYLFSLFMSLPEIKVS